jgi:hypothetical protein
VLIRVRTLLVALGLSVLAVFAPAVPALASGGFGKVVCGVQPRAGCDVQAGTPGSRGGDSSRPPVGGGCHDPQGVAIPCGQNALPGNGGCSSQQAGVSPGSVGVPGGQLVAEGSGSPGQCSGAATILIGGASPEVLGRLAVSQLRLPAVVIRVNPSGDQLVGLPTWLSVDASSWRWESATASVPGVSVTAMASPVAATWSMGDGTTVVCRGPGTPWTRGVDPARSSPDCGHTYAWSSAGAPGGSFTVTVTVAWGVSWAGAGRSGTLPGLVTVASERLRVAESQTVITG